MVVVLRLNYGEREVRLEGEDVIRFLRLPSLHRLATNNYATFCKVDLFANLRNQVPLGVLRANECGRDELATDVGFGQRFFVHATWAIIVLFDIVHKMER